MELHVLYKQQTLQKNKSPATAEIVHIILVTHDHVTKDEHTGLSQQQSLLS